MKIVITPESPEEEKASSVPADGLTFEKVPRFLLVMGANETWFQSVGNQELLRSDTDRMVRHFDKQVMVVAVQEAYNIITQAVAAQQAALPGGNNNHAGAPLRIADPATPPA